VYPARNHIDFERSLNSFLPWHQQSNLPYLLTQKLYEQVRGRNSAIHQHLLRESTFQIPAGQAPVSCILDDVNLNLTEREQMLWHHRLGHASMRHIQTLLANPRDSLATQIFVPKKANASTCAIPRCKACQYAKQTRNPTATTVKHRVTEQEGTLSEGILEPGQKVSVDLFQSKIPGRLPNTIGQEATHEQYAGGAIFYDLASKFITTLSETYSRSTTPNSLAVRSKEYLESIAIMLVRLV
jgi:hypothetical protein